MQNIPFVPSPNCWSGRFGAKPHYIIIHGTAGGTSAANIANWFANPAAQAAAHYIIDQAGVIIQSVQEADAAWACGVISGPAGVSGDNIHHDAWWDNAPAWNGAPNPNLNTISIEHVKAHDDNSDQLTPAQQASSIALVKDIGQRWQIPIRPADSSGGVTGHFSMDPVNRSRCPGNYPWDSLWRDSGPSSAGVPQGWHDDGKTLTAPNGIQVVRGFRTFVMDPKNQWHPDNHPVESEHAQAPLEISNPSYGNGTQQLFKWSMLGWTSAHGVFMEWVGEELLACRIEIAKLKASLPH